jgi:hypothetical protein
MFRRSLLCLAVTLACCVVPETARAATRHHRAAVAIVKAPVTHRGTLARVAGVCPLPTVICAAPTLVTGAVGVAGDIIGKGVDAAAGSVMSGVVSWAANGAAWLLGQIAGAVDRSTRPALDSDWYRREYASMAELAVALSALFLLLAVGHAIVRQDLGALIRAAFVALPLALLLTFTALTLVELGLALTDWMTRTVLATADGDPAGAFRRIGDVLVATTPGQPALAPFVVFLTSILTAVLALVVWVELVLREAAVYVAVAFLPITFVAMVWRPTTAWCRRLSEGLLAIVLSKFVVAVAFTLAAGALGHEGERSDGGLSAILGGCAVLLVAALAPWVVLRLIPFTQSAAEQTLSRHHVSGAARSAPGATTASIGARMLMFSSFGAARSGGARSGAVPPAAPAARRSSANELPDLPVAVIPDAGRPERRDVPR